MAEHGNYGRDKEGIVDIVFNDVLERTTREAEPERDHDRADTVQLEEQVVEHLAGGTADI